MKLRTTIFKLCAIEKVEKDIILYLPPHSVVRSAFDDGKDMIYLVVSYPEWKDDEEEVPYRFLVCSLVADLDDETYHYIGAGINHNVDAKNNEYSDWMVFLKDRPLTKKPKRESFGIGEVITLRWGGSEDEYADWEGLF